MNNPFINPKKKPDTEDGVYDDFERGLANRNSGTLLETLALDITPLGAHYQNPARVLSVDFVFLER